jgi:hypothetical protein
MKKILSDIVIFHGIMTWMDGKIDIAPETVYAKSYPYNELEDVVLCQDLVQVKMRILSPS